MNAFETYKRQNSNYQQIFKLQQDELQKIHETEKVNENTSGIVNAKESQAVFDYLVDEYPLLGNYLQIADFSGNDISNLAMVIPEVVRKEMNHVIWSKFLWSLGYIVVACFIAILFEQGQRQRKGVTTRRSRVSNRRVRMYR